MRLREQERGHGLGRSDFARNAVGPRNGRRAAARAGGGVRPDSRQRWPRTHTDAAEPASVSDWPGHESPLTNPLNCKS